MSYIIEIEIEIKQTDLRTGLHLNEGLMRIYEGKAGPLGYEWPWTFRAIRNDHTNELQGCFNSFTLLSDVELGYRVLGEVLSKQNIASYAKARTL